MTISIITCTYNASATFERTLESVATQDFNAIEHIIIDGHSTDDTLRMAEDYRQTSHSLNTGHRIKIISEVDDGLYFAMNKGIDMASGDYLLFLNAGDTFPNEHTLSTIFATITAAEPLPGVLFGDTDIVDNEGQFVRHRRLHPSGDLSWRAFRQGMVVCHQAFYALTEIAKVTLYDTHYRYSADIDWCIRIMKAAEEEGRSLVNVRQVVVNYLSEGLTTSHHKASLWERFRIMRRHYGLFSTIAMHVWFVVRAIFQR